MSVSDRPPPPPRGPRGQAAIGCALLIAGGLALADAPSWLASDARLTREQIVLRINPNTATRAELMLLPGIGPVLSDNIVEFRESATRRPAFGSAADLDDVHRIGPITVERLAPLLSFSDESIEESPADAGPPPDARP